MATNPSNPGVERREHPRHFVRIMVDYSATDTFLYDYSTDLSEGGIFIQTATPLNSGDQIDLRFTLPGLDRLFQIKGEVVWVNKKPEGGEPGGLDDLLAGASDMLSPAPDDMPEGMGIRFLNITAEEQALLRDFLSQERY